MASENIRVSLRERPFESITQQADMSDDSMKRCWDINEEERTFKYNLPLKKGKKGKFGPYTEVFSGSQTSANVYKRTSQELVLSAIKRGINGRLCV